VTETAMSQNGVIIRLPEERWQHITTRHQDLKDKKELVLNTITEPDYIFDGNEGALMAVQEITGGKLLVVIYKENSSSDGFIVTAFPTRRFKSLKKRRQIWP
jgi:hypothetical protein